jgi:LysR family hydrogen peroxide-inducible transcriptional activator
MPTLTQLEYIIAIDMLRHFGKAAKACHVTQPSLSMQVIKAEEELGVTIFDRNKKPVLPTDEGRAVIEQARQVVREHARLIEIARNQSSHLSGELRLAVIPTLTAYVVPLFIGKFSAAYPKISLMIDELKTEDIVKALHNDTMDVGLLATPLHEPKLEESPIFYEPFFLYAHPTHPLMKRKTIKEGDLDSDELWLLKDGHCLRNQIVNFCSLDPGRSGVYANVKFEGGTLDTLRQVIRGNARGYTIVPYLFAAGLSAAERTSSVRPFSAPIPTREVSLVVRRSHWKQRIIAALGDAIRAEIPQELQKCSPRQTIVEFSAK